MLWNDKQEMLRNCKQNGLLQFRRYSRKYHFHADNSLCKKRTAAEAAALEYYVIHGKLEHELETNCNLSRGVEESA
jgi:hypothetical protein